MENQASDIHGDLGHVISYQDQSQLGEVTLQQTVTQSIPVDDGSVVVGYPDNEDGGATTYIIRFVDGNMASYQQETQMQVQHIGDETVYQPIEGLVTDPGTNEAIRLAEKVLSEQSTDTPGAMVIGAPQGPISSHSHVSLLGERGTLVAGAMDVADASTDMQPSGIESRSIVNVGRHADSKTAPFTVANKHNNTIVASTGDTAVVSIEREATAAAQVREATAAAQVRETTAAVGAVREAAVSQEEDVKVSVASTRTRRVIKKPPKLKDFDSSDGRKPQKVIRLPTLTKTNLDVHDLFIEIEIGRGLFVGSLERTPLKNGNSKFKFRVSKQKFKGLSESDVSDIAAEPVSVSVPKPEPKEAKSSVKEDAKSTKKNSGKMPVKESVKSPVKASTRSPVTDNKLIIRTRSALRQEKMETKKSTASKQPANPKSIGTRKQTSLSPQTSSPKADTPLKVETPSRGRGRPKKIVKESAANKSIEQDQEEHNTGKTSDSLEPFESVEAENVDAESVDAEAGEDNVPAENYTDSVELQAALDEFKAIEAPIDRVMVKIEDTETDPVDMDVGTDHVEGDLDMGEELDAEMEEEAATDKKKKTKKPRKKRKMEGEDDDGDENNDGEPGSVRKRTYTRRNIYNKTDHNYTVRKTDDGKKLFVCGLCGHQCVSLANILDHLCVHTDFRPVPCPHCHMTFKSEKALKRHVIRHRDKSVICDACGALFCSQQDLKSHASVHRNDRTFKCDVCQRAFNHSTTLSRHKHTHRQDRRKHVCHMCGALFHRMDGVKRHIVNVHSDRHVLGETSSKLKQKNRPNKQQAEIGWDISTSYSRTQTIQTETNIGVSEMSLSTGIRSDRSANIRVCEKTRTGVQDSTNVINSVVTPAEVIPDGSVRPNNESRTGGSVTQTSGKLPVGFNARQPFSFNPYSVSSARIPVTSYCASDSRVELCKEGVGQSNQGVGQSNQGVGLSNQGVGLSNQGVGQSNQGVGLSNQGVGLSNQGVGLSNQGVGLSNQGVGLSNQGVGLSNQGVGLSNQGVGLSNQGVEPSSGLRPRYQQIVSGDMCSVGHEAHSSTGSMPASYLASPVQYQGDNQNVSYPSIYDQTTNQVPSSSQLTSCVSQEHVTQ